jgi:hypothetical protein
LKSDLAKEKHDPSFTDATLICQGQEIKIHKFMLASRSDVFKTMLTSQAFTEGDVLSVVTVHFEINFFTNG